MYTTTVVACLTICPAASLTLYLCVWFGQHGEPSVERVDLSDVDEAFVHETAEDVERLRPHVLDLLPHQPRLAARSTVLTVNLEGSQGGRGGREAGGREAGGREGEGEIGKEWEGGGRRYGKVGKEGGGA